MRSTRQFTREMIVIENLWLTSTGATVKQMSSYLDREATEHSFRREESDDSGHDMSYVSSSSDSEICESNTPLPIGAPVGDHKKTEKGVSRTLTVRRIVANKKGGLRKVQSVHT